MEIFHFETWGIVLMCVFGTVWLVTTILDVRRRITAKKAQNAAQRNADPLQRERGVEDEKQ